MVGRLGECQLSLFRIVLAGTSTCRAFSRGRMRQTSDRRFHRRSDSDSNGELHETGATLAKIDTGDVAARLRIAECAVFGKCLQSRHTEAALQRSSSNLPSGWD